MGHPNVGGAQDKSSWELGLEGFLSCAGFHSSAFELDLIPNRAGSDDPNR